MKQYPGSHSNRKTERDDVARAEADYHRFRDAHLALAKAEPDNLVGLAMIGADMDRAHAHLRHVINLRALPFTHDPTLALERRVRELSEQF